MFKKKFNATIINPAGNLTVLVWGLPCQKDRIVINNIVQKRFTKIEQVGFYDDYPQIQMAGGEFCGNALRSAVYLLLKGRVGTITMKSSGTNRLLQAGVKKSNTSFAEIPIKKNPIKKIRDDLWLVNLEGITHLIKILPSKLTKGQAKKRASKLLADQNLLSTYPAAGVMFVIKKKSIAEIQPVVWVRDIKTLLYETACASGTAAVGYLNATKEDNLSLQVLQPSRKILDVYIPKVNCKTPKVIIDGPIEILGKEKIII